MEGLCRLMVLPLLTVMFWNTENFFDYFDGGFSASDSEFSPMGKKHWTKKRFTAKTEAVCKTILAAGAPEIVGLAEVENDFVLQRLCGSELLRKLNYDYVHYESQDPRGIDVALMYRKDRMDLCGSRALTVPRSRDILYVCLRERSSGEMWHIIVNHHPSKYGGRTSQMGRTAAMRRLRQLADSLIAAGATGIIACGDFNDTPDAETFKLVEGALVNLGAELLDDAGILYGGNTGTIRFHGKWQLIDNFLVSPSVAEKEEMKIFRPSSLLERDSGFPGEKPRRTYIGPRYNAGVSDHLPVIIYQIPSKP